MRFPMLCNWLTIRKCKTDKGYEIINELSDDEVFMTTEYGDENYIKYIETFPNFV